MGVGSYDSLGRIKVITKAFSNSNYRGILEVRDPSGHYLPNDIDVNIKASSTGNLDIGDVMLVTKSGEGCKNINDLPATNTCFNNLAEKKYDLKATINDADGNNLEGVKVKVHKGHSVDGEVLNDIDLSSDTLTLNLPAGYYLLEFYGENHQTVYKRVTLDSSQNIQVAMKEDTDAFNIYKYVDN